MSRRRGRRRSNNGVPTNYPYNSEYRPYGTPLSSIFGGIFSYSNTSSISSLFNSMYQSNYNIKITINSCGIKILLAYPFILIDGLIKIHISNDGIKLYSTDDKLKLKIVGVDQYDM